MADAPSLGDFFAKKTKKKVKASNLNPNSQVSATAKPEEKKKGKKEDEDAAGWKDEEVAAPVLKAGIEVGKLVREDDDDKEEAPALAWGKPQKAREEKRTEKDEKRFPELRAAMGFRESSNINIDDGSDQQVNIKTSKNAFSALEDDEDDEAEEQGKKKRPKEIKPAMVRKQQGEREKDVLAREVGKYRPNDSESAKVAEVDEEKERRKAEKKAEKEEEKKRREQEKEKGADKENAGKKKNQEEAVDEAEDTKIAEDKEAARNKYKGRKKLPKVDLDPEELKDPEQEKRKPKKKFVAEVDF